MQSPHPTQYDPELLKHATPQELEQITLELENEIALLSPADYARTIHPKSFQEPPHITLISGAIADLVGGRLLKPDGTPYRRLLITTPPRHGKSWLISKYTPAWYLTKYPDRNVILTSYEADFAATWGSAVRDLIDEFGARFGISLDPNNKSAKRWRIFKRLGGMKTAGAGGPITGSGGHLIIVDDPIKNDEEAESSTIREKIWNWFQGTLLTRREPDAVLIQVQTRWHEDDLSGRALLMEPDEWYHIDLPALALEHDVLGRTPGQALWPERYDEKTLAGIQTSVGPRVWAALYQQRPVIDGAGIFRSQQFRYASQYRKDGVAYVRLHQPDGTYKDFPFQKCWKFTTVDAAGTKSNTADYTVFATFVVTPDLELVQVDLFRERIESDLLLEVLEKQVFLRHPDTRWAGVEDITFGKTLLQRAQRLGKKVRPLKPDRDKTARGVAAASYIAGGRVYFMKDLPHLEEYIRELLVFDHGAHDDMVDTLAYATTYLADIDRNPRVAKPPEDDSYDARVWRNVTNRRRKKKGIHPELGGF